MGLMNLYFKCYQNFNVQVPSSLRGCSVCDGYSWLVSLWAKYNSGRIRGKKTGTFQMATRVILAPCFVICTENESKHRAFFFVFVPKVLKHRGEDHMRGVFFVLHAAHLVPSKPGVRGYNPSAVNGLLHPTEVQVKPPNNRGHSLRLCAHLCPLVCGWS